MHIRGCSSSHFIWTIQDGVMKRVHDTDSHGRPLLKFKKLEDIYQSADAERTPLPFAERKTRLRSGFVGDDEPACQSNEDDFQEMTLSQLRKKCKRKKRKVSEYVLLTPKVEEDDDPDLSEPLCKFKVKGSKHSPFKTTPTNSSYPTSCRKDISTVTVKVEVSDMENFECKDTTLMENCGFNEVPVYNLDNMESDNEDDDMHNGITPMQASEMDKEEYVCHPLSIVSSLEDDDSSFEDLITSTSDCFESQQTPEQVGYMCGGQDLESTISDDHCCVDFEQSSDLYTVESGTHEYDVSTPMPDYLCLPWRSHVDEVTVEVKSPIREEEEDLTSVNTCEDLNSLISDIKSSNSDDVFVLQDPSLDPANADSEVKFDHNQLTDVLNETSEVRNSDCEETRFPERLPLTRKAISPSSQEKLCLAMKSAELSDDVDRYKCKEKLNFDEQNENKFSSTRSEIKDNEPNSRPHQATLLSQNKVFISSKQLLKRPKNYKKGSPPKSLDGPRLCRSLPRLSTGCTSIQGCSESAIAFSERQMHDIESLASKLMSELNSMKAIVENKLLFEAYRSTPLNNEADEVKSAIKSATKTEETAKKWLSMMARDCNRFCKIMKLNQDDNPMGTTIKEKPVPLEKERKKISFADEAGGTLCDVKVFCIDQESLELNEKLEPSLA